MNLRQAKLAQQEFEDKVRRLDKQLSQVRSRKRRPKPRRRSASVGFKVGDLGDTMKTVEEILQKRYEVSAGKARVAKDMVNMDSVAGEGKRAQGARAGRARRVPREPGHPDGGPAAGEATARGGKEIGPNGADDGGAPLHRARQARLDRPRRRAHRPRRVHDRRSARRWRRRTARPSRAGADDAGEAAAVAEVQVEVPKLAPPAPFS